MCREIPQLQFRPLRLTSALLVWLLAGCGTLPVAYGPPPADVSTPAPAVEQPLLDAPAVIHVHTTYSDGHKSIPAIAEIAQRQGIRVLYITDHDTVAGQPDAGWYGNTLVLVGEELSTLQGHLLRLNTTHSLPMNQDAAPVIERTSAEGGLTFAAHPRKFKDPWTGEYDSLNGFEVYNLAADLVERPIPRLAIAGGLLPSSLAYKQLMHRPDELLVQWDRLTQTRRVVGTAGSDAHGHQFTPLLRFAPYDLALAFVRTHLLLPEVTPDAVHRALAEGHAYIGFDIFGDTTGFTFVMLRNNRIVASIGDRHAFSDGLSAYVWAPRVCAIRVFRNGELVRATLGYEDRWNVEEPGVYRVECELAGRPWIISNPIYYGVPQQEESVNEYSKLT